MTDLTADLMVALGYSLKRDRGHAEVWYHPDFDTPLVVSKTPSDWRSRKNELAQLKRRHPDAPECERRKSDRPRTKKRVPRANGYADGPVGPVVFLPEFEARPRVWRQRCEDCGRPHHKHGVRPLDVCPDCGSRRLNELRTAA